MEIKNAVCVRCYNEIMLRGNNLREKKGDITKLEFLMELKRLGDTDCYVCHSIEKCMVCQILDNIDKVKDILITST